MKKFSLSLRLVFVAIAACLTFACSNTNSSSEAPVSANSSPSPGGAKLGQLAEYDVARISVDEARKLVAEGKAIIVDVRGSESYKMSHIKGSLDFALHKLEAGDYKGLPKDKIIITYCACPAENSSARAAAVLKKAGFKDPGALVGGIQAWESSGGEIEKASQDPPRKG